MSEVEIINGLSEAIKVTMTARASLADVTPLWNKANRIVKYLEAQVASELKAIEAA